MTCSYSDSAKQGEGVRVSESGATVTGSERGYQWAGVGGGVRVRLSNEMSKFR